MYNINLDIENYEVIKKVNIHLNKLNVVVGENGSGKSIIRKLLSCFLIASSKKENIWLIQVLEINSLH